VEKNRLPWVRVEHFGEAGHDVDLLDLFGQPKKLNLDSARLTRRNRDRPGDCLEIVSLGCYRVGAGLNTPEREVAMLIGNRLVGT